MMQRQDPFEGQISLSDVQSLQDTKPIEEVEAASSSSEETPSKKQKKLQGDVTMTGEPADKVVIEPNLKQMHTMQESVDQETHAIVVGGFSPFTKAHQALVAHARSKYKHVHVFTTQSKTRPIPAEDKVKYIKHAVGKDVQVSTTQTPLHAAAEVFKRGAKKAVFVGGSDRKSIVDRLNQYNGKESAHGHYHFKEPIKLEVFGSERKEGSEGLAGVSGTKARAAKTPEELKQYLPTELHSHAVAIHRQIHEHFELIERVVGVRQRLRRAVTMKKYKSKLSRARSISRKRFASSKALRRRAFKRAKNIVRTRVVGRRGAGYNKMTMAQKIAIDQMVANKAPVIKKVAARIGPRVRRDEVRRLSAVSQRKKFRLTNLPITSSYEPNAREIKALNEKAEKHNIPLSTLLQVFKRGMAAAEGGFKPTTSSAQQQAFARINSFIRQGKSFKQDDKDLAVEDIRSYPHLHTMKVARNVEKIEKLDVPKKGDGVVNRLRKLHGEIQRKIIETAGEEGTKELAHKYAKETPGQKSPKRYKKTAEFRAHYEHVINPITLSDKVRKKLNKLPRQSDVDKLLHKATKHAEERLHRSMSDEYGHSAAKREPGTPDEG